MKIITTCLGFLLLLCSCTNREKDNTGTPSVIRAGTIAVVQCLADSNEQYVLLKPDGFPGNRKWPLIVCFDPHADGRLPVERLRSFGEEHGYLLVGSNSIKNGLATTSYSLQILMEELRSRYPVDQGRIYLVGFSGGGRVALSLATSSAGFRGVITCGAGAPGYDFNKMPGKTDVFALAGDGDFNYGEVERLPAQPAPVGIHIFARIFHGTHDWPPSAEMERAMCWMEMQAMKSGLIEKDDAWIERTKLEIMDSVSWYEKQQDLPEALSLCRLGISMLDELSSIRSLHKTEMRIAGSESWKKFTREETRIKNLENTARDSYTRAMTEKDTLWWRKEVNALNAFRKSNASTSMKAMYNRLFGFMSIMAYSYSNQSIRSGDLVNAKKFVDVYGIIDPENPDYINFHTQLNSVK